MSFFGIPQFRKEIHFIGLVEFEGDEKLRWKLSIRNMLSVSDNLLRFYTKKCIVDAVQTVILLSWHYRGETDEFMKC